MRDAEPSVNEARRVWGAPLFAGFLDDFVSDEHGFHL